jgi:hypothetical protein
MIVLYVIKVYENKIILKIKWLYSEKLFKMSFEKKLKFLFLIIIEKVKKKF